MEKYIQIKRDSVLKIGILDENGVDTGKYLEFDLEDIESPFRYQEVIERHKQNFKDVQAQFMIINKRQDKKGKKVLSLNEEARLKALREFYKKEEEALDLFLGIGGTKKILNGRNPYFSMFNDIDEILKPILPLLKQGYENVNKKIIDKYKVENTENVLKS